MKLNDIKRVAANIDKYQIGTNVHMGNVSLDEYMHIKDTDKHKDNYLDILRNNGYILRKRTDKRYFDFYFQKGDGSHVTV